MCTRPLASALWPGWCWVRCSGGSSHENTESHPQGPSRHRDHRAQVRVVRALVRDFDGQRPVVSATKNLPRAGLEGTSTVTLPSAEDLAQWITTHYLNEQPSLVMTARIHSDFDALLAEVERLRSMEDATQAGFDEMLADLGKARTVIQTLGKERDAALMAETKAQLEVARLREAK